MDTGDFGNAQLAPIDLVRLGLKGLAGEYLPGMTHSELGDRTVDLQGLRQQFDGIIAVNMSEADRAGVAAQAGVRTMAQYLAARTNISVSRFARTSLLALGGQNAQL